MGKFIDEVAKINLNENHKLKISEERDNVRNALYKRINREFRDCDDIDETYNYLTNLHTKYKICYKEHDFGTRVTMEFIDTTYFRELKKVYKMYKEHEKAVKNEEEKEEISSLYLVMDEKGATMLNETFTKHAENNIPYDVEKTEKHIIKHYIIRDRDKKPYVFKIYYFKENGALDVLSTTNDLRKDGLLDGIKIHGLSPFNPLNILIAIPIIVYLLYIGFHALIGIGLILFVVLIILCG